MKVLWFRVHQINFKEIWQCKNLIWYNYISYLLCANFLKESTWKRSFIKCMCIIKWSFCAMKSRARKQFVDMDTFILHFVSLFQRAFLRLNLIILVISVTFTDILITCKSSLHFESTLRKSILTFFGVTFGLIFWLQILSSSCLILSLWCLLDMTPNTTCSSSTPIQRITGVLWTFWNDRLSNFRFIYGRNTIIVNNTQIYRS